MGLFSFFKKKPEDYFTIAEDEQIVNAIRAAEKETSGEVRVYIESKNPYVNPLDRAGEIFFSLKMNQTEKRNGVLLYIAMKHHEVALFADEGIYEAVGAAWWHQAVNDMLAEFKDQHIADGIEHCVQRVGQLLREKFPYDAGTDKNELPDEIVFGK
ncbi:MAG TPA: TPM domain-containing protein [Ferruginibacter sp.]|nr:TPM domain-containing protein [Ferruginibacter sp.]HMP20404.1 TPM domain-containing protein [Ferruginibacter sp.]